MAKTADRFRRVRPGAAGAASDDNQAWTRVLSLTGALLSHLAANPDTRRLVTEMLAAGVPLTPDLLAGADSRFDEPLIGLHIRELCEPDVFSRFFGARGVAQ